MLNEPFLEINDLLNQVNEHEEEQEEEQGLLGILNNNLSFTVLKLLAPCGKKKIVGYLSFVFVVCLQ